VTELAENQNKFWISANAYLTTDLRI